MPAGTLPAVKLVIAAALVALTHCAFAAQGFVSYPTKPIRLLVPFAAGGGADVACRAFVQRLSERLGQSIIFENRGGAGGVLAGETVARASPDGYTLLLGAVSVMTTTTNLMEKKPFDPVRDFAPITRIVNVPSMLAARSGFAPRTVKELVDYAKASPGKLTWALSGIGSAGHLATERFKIDHGLKTVQVFYKGAGPATIALLSSEADVLFANPGVFAAHIKAGRLRGVALAAEKRLGIMPDLATFAEQGYPGYENGSWYGLVAPAGAPAAVINRLHEESIKVLNEPDIVAGMAREGGSPVGNTPQQFAQEIRVELERSAKVIKAAGIKVNP
jgi:tripartite-type tricarboxylate transporter receptor subunit TctC